jgi:hypothetical protein
MQEARGQALLPGCKWIEKPDFDTRRRSQTEQQQFSLRRIKVVHQQAHAHTALPGIAQHAQQVAAGFIVLDVVVLHVQ